MSTLAVVERILRDTKVPMSVREIVEAAGSALPTRSKTPDTVVARDLSMDIKRKADTSLFVRTAPGRYTLREISVSSGNGVRALDSAAIATTADVVSASMTKERAGTKPATPARPVRLEERQPG